MPSVLSKKYYKSKKRYSAGDIVMTCDPIAYVVIDGTKGLRCDHCLKPNDSLKKCANCQKMFYCGIECQTNDWKIHKHECKLYAKHDNQLTKEYATRLLLRLYQILRHDKTIADTKYRLDHNDFEISFEDLMKTIPDRVYNYRECKKQAMDQEIGTYFIGLREHWTEEWLKPIKKLGKLCDIKVDNHLCNTKTGSKSLNNLFWFLRSFVTKIATYDESGLEEYSNVRPGVGIYVPFWALKHSCVPNTAEVWNGLKIEVRAMRDIEVGEELTRNYMALGIKKSDRNQILVEKFFDKCECNRCLLSTSDADIDYKKLAQSRRGLKELDLTESKKRFELSAQILEITSRYYLEFHPMHTLDTLGYVKNALLYKSDLKEDEVIDERLSDEKINEKIKSAFDNLKVTHGIDHQIYRKFKEFVAKSVNQSLSQN
jgi:hypothetical protein